MGSEGSYISVPNSTLLIKPSYASRLHLPVVDLPHITLLVAEVTVSHGLRVFTGEHNPGTNRPR
jgi:hypothetical protein